MSSSKPITRITLFKIPEEAQREHLLGIYKKMPEEAVKVRKSHGVITARP